MEELKLYQLPTNQKRRQALEDALFTATALYNHVNQEMDYYEDDGIDACASLDLPEGITVGEERYRRTYNIDDAHQPKGNKRKMDTGNQDARRGGGCGKKSYQSFVPQSGRGVSSLAGETPRRGWCKEWRRRHPLFSVGRRAFFSPRGYSWSPRH